MELLFGPELFGGLHQALFLAAPRDASLENIKNI